MARELVHEAATLSRFIYLPKPIVVNVDQVEFAESIALRIRLKAYVLDTLYEKCFTTDVTLRELIVYRGVLHCLSYDYESGIGGFYTSRDGRSWTWNARAELRNIRPIKAHVWSGALWISTSPFTTRRIPPAGVYRWDGSDWEHTLAGSVVYPRIESRDGRVWAGSAESGCGVRRPSQSTSRPARTTATRRPPRRAPGVGGAPASVPGRVEPAAGPEPAAADPVPCRSGRLGGTATTVGC